MRATEFEFRHRFWLILLTYVAAFGSYSFDPMNVVVVLAGWMFRGSDPNLKSLVARHALQALFAFSAVLVAAAAWIRTWGSAYLRAEVVHDLRLHTDRLVADGPYRHLRNPLYLGTMLLAAGLAMMASRTGAVVLILGNLLITLRLIGREEAALSGSQGEAFRAFMAAVPRFWPSLRPCLPAGDVQPRWAQAFLGEGWVWIFALDGFVFAWKLNGHLYTTLTWSCAGTYLLVRMVLRARRNETPPPTSNPPSTSSE